MGDLNQNEHYLFFELSSKSKFAKEIQKISDAKRVAIEKAASLAITFHKDATPLGDNRYGMAMEGILVPETVSIGGWRQWQGAAKGNLVPWMSTKAGKIADKQMRDIDYRADKGPLKVLIVKHFGKDAMKFRTVAAKGFSRHLLDWTTGMYPVDGKGSIYILRLLKTDEAEAAKVRGCKRIKYSRLVEIEEISNGESN